MPRPHPPHRAAVHACVALLTLAVVWALAALDDRSRAVAADPGPVSVSSSPGLRPAFTPSAPDYTVDCTRSKNQVALTFDASGSTKVSVNGGPATGGHSTASFPLKAGHAFTFTIDAGPDAGTYHARCLPKNFPGYVVTRNGPTQAAFYVMSISYIGTAKRDYTAVFNGLGVPMWWKRESHGLPFNGMLLPNGDIAWYRFNYGQFGDDPSTGFYEYTLSGRRVRTYKAHGGPVDLHELQVLPNHHRMVIAYRARRHVDLSKYGKPSDATVMDGQIQETDRHNRLVWSWRTGDHIPLADSRHWLKILQPLRLHDGQDVYDIVHLNTIDPHGSKIVISLRHADAVYEIDKKSGNVVWKLGGRRTSKSLKIVGDPLASKAFGGQHDARLSSDGQFLTVYDNGSHRSRPPRALLYRIDTANKTATLLESVTDPRADESACCGSARKLPGGDWVISWASRPYVTETDAAGNLLLRLDFLGRSAYRAYPVLPGVLDPAKLRAGMDAMAK